MELLTIVLVAHEYTGLPLAIASTCQTLGQHLIAHMQRSIGTHQVHGEVGILLVC